MSGAVFLSRILGLVREQVFAFFFGAGTTTDAFLVAFRIPNLLRDLLAEGAMSSAFVTVFSREKNESKAQETAANVASVLALLLGFVCLLIFVFSYELVFILAPDFAKVAGKIELTVLLTKIFSSFLFFVSFAALSMGTLNTKGYFFWPALGPAAFNVGSIGLGSLGAWLFRDQGFEAMIIAFTVANLIGGAMQWLVQWPLLFKLGYNPWIFIPRIISPSKITQAFKDPAVAKIGKLMAPAILSTAAVQFYVVINSIIAASLAEGSVSWLNYSFRLLHFPLGVFGVALSVASLPSFAKLIHENKDDDFKIFFKKALRLSWILAIGSAAGLIAFREPLVSLMFERGLFTREDTLQCALALAAYAISLPFLNTNKIFLQVFYAKDKVWIPSTINVLFIITHYLLAQWGAQHYGHVGIALATSITSISTTVILSVVLTYWRIPLFDLESVKIVIAAAIGSALIFAFEYFGGSAFLMTLKNQSSLYFITATLIAVAVMGGLYLVITALPSNDVRVVLKRLTKNEARKPHHP